MGIRDWQQIAFNEKGRPCTPIFWSPKSFKAEVYKNKVFIYQPDEWLSKEKWAENTAPIGVVHSGCAYIGDVHVIAFNSRPDGLTFAAAVWSLVPLNGALIPQGFVCVSKHKSTPITEVDAEYFKNKLVEWNTVGDQPLWLPPQLAKIDLSRWEQALTI